MGWLEEIAKALPIKEIYQDAAQPAVKQVGQALEKTIKTARFVLAPVESIAAQHVRWERYLERISEKVPEENLIEADPQIAGPVFENLRYAKENSLIAEMFLNLLARAIDKERVHVNWGSSLRLTLVKKCQRSTVDLTPNFPKFLDPKFLPGSMGLRSLYASVTRARLHQRNDALWGQHFHTRAERRGLVRQRQ